jgi:phosphotransferase system enzyme I (PtsI)
VQLHMKALADKALTDAETNEDVIALVKSVTQA